MLSPTIATVSVASTLTATAAPTLASLFIEKAPAAFQTFIAWSAATYTRVALMSAWLLTLAWVASPTDTRPRMTLTPMPLPRPAVGLRARRKLEVSALTHRPPCVSTTTPAPRPALVIDRWVTMLAAPPTAAPSSLPPVPWSDGLMLPPMSIEVTAVRACTTTESSQVRVL